MLVHRLLSFTPFFFSVRVRFDEELGEEMVLLLRRVKGSLVGNRKEWGLGVGGTWG